MTAWGRVVARLVTMFLAVAGCVTVGALPAAADSSGPVRYVALGDSYAAGQGGGEYLNDCLQSPNGYPYLLEPKRGSISAPTPRALARQLLKGAAHSCRS